MTGHAKFQAALIAVLVEARESAGFSQRALSDRIDRPPSYVWRLESGAQPIKAYDMHAIARAVGTTFAELATRVQKRL